MKTTRPSAVPLRERVEHLMMSYAAQVSGAQRAVHEVRRGVPAAQKEVDYCNKLADKAVDRMMELLAKADPAELKGLAMPA